MSQGHAREHSAVTLSNQATTLLQSFSAYSCVCRCLAKLTENESDPLKQPATEHLRAALSQSVPSAVDGQVLCTCLFVHCRVAALILPLALLSDLRIVAFRSPWLLSIHIWRAPAVRRPAPSKRLQTQCVPVAAKMYVSRQKHPSCQYN